MANDAEIVVGADASAVDRAAKVAIDSWRNAGASISQSFKSAATNIVASIGDIVLAQGKVNFASLHAGVRDFESATARVAVASGRDFEAVRSNVERVGLEIGKRPSEMIAWEGAVGRLTYSYTGLEESLRGVSGLAAATGRTAEDYQNLAVGLDRLGVRGADVSNVLGTMAAQAKAMKTDGGVGALADQFDAASEAALRFGDRGAEGVKRITGFIAVMGQGLDNVTAGRVANQALGAISGDPLRWERYLGHHVVDDKTGRMQDPASMYKEIYDKSARTFGAGSEGQRYALMRNFDPSVGLAIMRAGKSGRFDQVGALAGMTPSGELSAAQHRLQTSDAGQREGWAAKLEVSARDLMGSSTELGKAADTLQKFAASNPIAANAGSSFAGGALSFGAGAAVKGLWGIGKRLLGGGAGGAASGGAAEGTAASGAGGGALSALLPFAAITGGAMWMGAKREHIGNLATGRGFNSNDEAMEERFRTLKGTRATHSAPSKLMGGEQSWDDVAAKIGAAVTSSMSSKKFTVVNATKGPITVVDDSGYSSSAGGQ